MCFDTAPNKAAENVFSISRPFVCTQRVAFLNHLNALFNRVRYYALADDLLDGAEEIAEFLFGNAQKKKKRRRVYHLAATGQLPLARMGSRLIGRKSTLRRHLAEGERAGLQGVK